MVNLSLDGDATGLSTIIISDAVGVGLDFSNYEGGDGEVWATNLDKIQFYGPFSLKIGKNFVGETVTGSTPAEKTVELINYQ